ncbi:MAG: hypothetical protein DMF11_12125 [Verrucomicrobia bacterium]|nr:MAG: hypothetical protein DMF11_12125 [Verrucomicrobiota bacterium]
MSGGRRLPPLICAIFRTLRANTQPASNQKKSLTQLPHEILFVCIKNGPMAQGLLKACRSIWLSSISKKIADSSLRGCTKAGLSYQSAMLKVERGWAT